MSNTLTADNITDDQIRELRHEALDHGDRALTKVTSIGLGEWFSINEIVDSDMDYLALMREARAKCAEILNAR